MAPQGEDLESLLRPRFMQLGVGRNQFASAEHGYRIHQRLGGRFHIRLHALIPVEINVAFGIGSEIADVCADVGFVASGNHADVFEPIGEDAPEVFNSCRVTVDHDREGTASEMARRSATLCGS